MLFAELHVDNIQRIKVWNPKGTIVFSDEEELIGKSFPENPNFQKAILGKTAIVIQSPSFADNYLERGRDHFMELYVPIQLDHPQISGVIEIYLPVDQLYQRIRATQKSIFITLVLGFGLLGILMYAYLQLLSRRYTIRLQELTEHQRRRQSD